MGMFKKGTYTGRLIPAYEREVNKLVRYYVEKGDTEQVAKDKAESIMCMYAHQYREVSYK